MELIMHVIKLIIAEVGVFGFIGISLAAVYGLWLFYLASMNIIRAKEAGTISKPALILGYPIVIVALLLDVLVNVFVMTLVFVEPPQEWLVTQRLERHWANPPGFRHTIATFICKSFLNTFDPSGDHCSGDEPK